MRYCGGKARLAAWIVDHIQKLAVGGSGRYVEPFVGGASVLEEVCRRGIFRRVEAGDLLEDLVLLWKMAQTGWDPPTSITRDLWEKLRDSEPSALRGFAGCGASLGGLWFRTYARAEAGIEDDRTVQASVRSVKRTAQFIRNVRFKHQSYNQWEVKDGDVVYTDIPYFGTEPYKAVEPFDHDSFWLWAHSKSLAGVRVIVSEYACPFSGEGWAALAANQRNSAFNVGNQHTEAMGGSKNASEVERLFIHEKYLNLF